MFVVPAFIITLKLLKDNWILAYLDPTRSKDHTTNIYIAIFINSMDAVTCCFLILDSYEGCSNMNASGFITFFTYMLRQSGKRFYKGLHVTFIVAPDLKKNRVYLSSFSPLNEGHVCILTNSMLQKYTSDIDERIILRRTGEIS